MTDGKDEAAVKARALETDRADRGRRRFWRARSRELRTREERPAHRRRRTKATSVSLTFRTCAKIWLPRSRSAGRRRHRADSHAGGLSDSSRRRAHARRQHADVQRQSCSRSDVDGTQPKERDDLSCRRFATRRSSKSPTVTAPASNRLETQAAGDGQERRQERREKEEELTTRIEADNAHRRFRFDLCYRS